MVTERRRPVTLGRWVAVQQLASFSRRQWKVAGWSYLAAVLIMGVAGETLPAADRPHCRDLRPARPAPEGPPLGQNRNRRWRSGRHPHDGLPRLQPARDP